MKTIHYLFSVLFFSLCLCGQAFAQESCTEELQDVLDTCIKDATEVCQANVPECEPTGFTVEVLRETVESKCGVCNADEITNVKNFGQANRCYKQSRNGFRKAGFFKQDNGDDLREELARLRRECKAAIKANKKKDDDDSSSDDDDSSADDDDSSSDDSTPDV